ncbi:MAG: hypothetical protein ABIT37_18920 [Luteolibacter sp.]
MKFHHLLLAGIPFFGAVLYAQEATSPEIPAIDPAHIVQSTTYDLGERLMTVQEVTKDELPTPPPPSPPLPVPPFVEQRPDAPEVAEQGGTLMMGGTVFLSKNGPPRTLITYRPQGSHTEITFWSSADWRLLTNAGPLVGTDGKTWDLMLMLSIQEIDSQTDPEELVQLAPIPNFPPGKATCQVIGGNPTAQMMAPIALFHAKYDADFQMLHADFLKREEEQKLREAEIKAHPPEKKDVVLRFRMLEPNEISKTPTSAAK